MTPAADWSEPMLRAKAALVAAEEELACGRYVLAQGLLEQVQSEVEDVLYAILERTK